MPRKKAGGPASAMSGATGSGAGNGGSSGSGDGLGRGNGAGDGKGKAADKGKRVDKGKKRAREPEPDESNDDEPLAHRVKRARDKSPVPDEQGEAGPSSSRAQASRFSSRARARGLTVSVAASSPRVASSPVPAGGDPPFSRLARVPLTESNLSLISRGDAAPQWQESDVLAPSPAGSAAELQEVPPPTPSAQDGDIGSDDEGLVADEDDGSRTPRPRTPVAEEVDTTAINKSFSQIRVSSVLSTPADENTPQAAGEPDGLSNGKENSGVGTQRKARFYISGKQGKSSAGEGSSSGKQRDSASGQRGASSISAQGLSQELHYATLGRTSVEDNPRYDPGFFGSSNQLNNYPDYINPLLDCSQSSSQSSDDAPYARATPTPNSSQGTTLSEKAAAASEYDPDKTPEPEEEKCYEERCH